MAITAKMVKELREQTGAGMMDCKKALTETDGDMEKAVDYLREKGIAKAAKKAGRIAAEGLTHITEEGNTAVLIEVNCETDFVTKNEQFKQLLEDLGKHLASQKPADVEEALSDIFHDPQTSGGLLISLPSEYADAIVEDMLSNGTISAAVIGEVIPKKEKYLEIN